jgi:hypothetical protein
MQSLKSKTNILSTVLRFAEYGDPVKVVKKFTETLDVPNCGSKL